MMAPGNMKQDVLGDLIKYLRRLEIEDKGSADEPMGKGKVKETLMVGMEPHDMHEEDGIPEDERLHLEEPDLDMKDEDEKDEPLTPVQEKMRDFMNNRRPASTSRNKKSQMMFADNRSAPAPKGKGKFK